MTAVGKILVFMNLLFSVAVAALIVVVFTTRTNWKNEYEKVKNVSLVAEAAYKTEKLSHENDIKSRESQIKSLAIENATIIGERDQARLETVEVKKQVKDEQNEKTSSGTNHAALVKEVTALKDERTVLTAEAAALRVEVLRVQKDRDDQRLIGINNKIESDAQTAKARRLLERVEELERTVTVQQNRLNSLGASGSTGGTTSLLNAPATPAPRDVRGTVRAVSADTSGLTVINLGSDSGLSIGNKLEVYLIDAQNPKNSIYLGELVISRTEPKQAVGRFNPKPFAKPEERLPKVDDIVSTSLGNR